MLCYIIAICYVISVMQSAQDLEYKISIYVNYVVYDIPDFVCSYVCMFLYS